jgi:hypothetical protein
MEMDEITVIYKAQKHYNKTTTKTTNHRRYNDWGWG